MNIQTPTYVLPALPATVLRYDGKTLHIMTNNPNSTVDPNGNVVLNISKINAAKPDDSNAVVSASTEAQGTDSQKSAQNPDASYASVDLTV